MSMRDRILRRPLPTGCATCGMSATCLCDVPKLSNPHHECHAAADSLSAAYESSIARMQHTIDQQAAWIARQAAQIDTLKMVAGIPADITVSPALIGGPAWTPRQRTLSRRLDDVIYRLERGGCSWPVRVWLGWRRRRLERAMEVAA